MKITHEEAIKRLMNMDIKNVSYDDIWFFTQYIKQEEKKDKLLELYREHKKLVPFKPGLGKDSKRVIDISIEIQTLEEEMK